jgi:hypothetical protein
MLGAVYLGQSLEALSNVSYYQFNLRLSNLNVIVVNSIEDIWEIVVDGGFR